MADDKLAQKRNMGPEPMKAQPNHDREKTYEPANPPKEVVSENQKLPEKTAEAKVETDMTGAVEEVKKRL